MRLKIGVSNADFKDDLQANFTRSSANNPIETTASAYITG
jgi:hypothetical protein